MQSRRLFLKALSAGIGGAFTCSAQAIDHADRQFAKSLRQTLSTGWKFRLDPDGSAEPPVRRDGWHDVQVPHTWQALGRSPEYSGVAWYQIAFHAPQEWRANWVRIEFEAVTHTAHVFLNGKPVGEHIGKGYTAFTVDLSPSLLFGSDNVLTVRVDNRPGDRMLPRNKSYDWTDDGGIIRPVHLLVAPPILIERVWLRAMPNLQDGSAEVQAEVYIRNTAEHPAAISLHGSFLQEGTSGPAHDWPEVVQTIQGASSKMVSLPKVRIADAALWHFDTPHLYKAQFVAQSSWGYDEYEESFGIRQFEVRDRAFYLNGEKVSLIGVERMAGSNPDFGMAETLQWITANHADMKELNCIYTRVHWPQDRRVLDLCDRHGILMQEEIPAWGPETFHETTDDVQHALERNGLEQMREMIQRDGNHPCIVTWGLCNEVDGKNPRAKQFARLMSQEARRLDPTRLQTYASHSLRNDPGEDMAGEFDFISDNEYFGSWYPGGEAELRKHLQEVSKAFPTKPVVVSEYGWCECQPSISPGDENRVNIIERHTSVFREFASIAGAIYFDYNDYRTLVGDKGAPPLRQRVHGTVDLYANRKPSFEALRKQCSPIESAILRRKSGSEFELDITIRRQLPGYTLRGYVVKTIAHGYDDLPMQGTIKSLPDLAPGQDYSVDLEMEGASFKRICVSILRPSGASVLDLEYLLEAALA